MIAVLEWIDGFGHDTAVIGIFSSIKKARATFANRQHETDEKQLRYQSFEPNKKCWFDWYDAEKLFPKSGKQKKENW